MRYPSWAYDGFVREGRAALARFLGRPCETSRWIAANVPRAGQMHVLASLIFRIEGGEVNIRRRWPLADKLRLPGRPRVPWLWYGTG